MLFGDRARLGHDFYWKIVGFSLNWIMSDIFEVLHVIDEHLDG